jgi:hypothetical protein
MGSKMPDITASQKKSFYQQYKSKQHTSKSKGGYNSYLLPFLT